MTETFYADAEWVRALLLGGMKHEAQNFLFQLVGEYKEKASKRNEPAAKLHYLVEALLPEIQGGEVVIPQWVRQQMFWKPQEIAWSEWIANFPGCSVEGIEDKENGKTMEITCINSHPADDYKKIRAGLFYSPNGFNDTPSAGKIRRRTKGNVKFLNAVFVDMDGASTQELKELRKKQILEFPLVPSYVVETKNGFHVIWLCERSYGPEWTETWFEVQTGLIGHFKSDEACKDWSRLLRMPSSWHCKDLFKGGEAYWVKLVHQSGLRYTLDDFAQYRKIKKVFDLSTRTEVAGDATLYVPTITGITKDHRHATLNAEASRVYRSAGSHRERANECRTIVLRWYEGACVLRKQEWEAEANAVCDWFESEQFK